MKRGSGPGRTRLRAIGTSSARAGLGGSVAQCMLGAACPRPRGLPRWCWASAGAGRDELTVAHEEDDVLGAVRHGRQGQGCLQRPLGSPVPVARGLLILWKQRGSRPGRQVGQDGHVCAELRVPGVGAEPRAGARLQGRPIGMGSPGATSAESPAGAGESSQARASRSTIRARPCPATSSPAGTSCGSPCPMPEPPELLRLRVHACSQTWGRADTFQPQRPLFSGPGGPQPLSPTTLRAKVPGNRAGGPRAWHLEPCVPGSCVVSPASLPSGTSAWESSTRLLQCSGEKPGQGHVPPTPRPIRAS